MARTTPVNEGFIIANSVEAEGSLGERVDVWVEYKIGATNYLNNTVALTAYFYAACQTGQTTGASYVGGLNSTFTVNEVAGTGVSGGTYDFTKDTSINLCGSWEGSISFTGPSTKDVPVVGEFTTKSTNVSGGSITTTIPVPYVVFYDVIFNANGHGEAPAAVEVMGGNSITLPTISATGYKFKGWATDKKATVGMTGTYTPTKDITLYAIWKAAGSYMYLNNNGTAEKCEVYYNNNGSVVKCDVYYNDNGTAVKM